jgi:hypothetical protein
MIIDFQSLVKEMKAVKMKFKDLETATGLSRSTIYRKQFDFDSISLGDLKKINYAINTLKERNAIK